MRTASSPVFFVGAGPGVADLLTLRAARALGRADVVLHDALISPDVLALAPDAVLVNVGKRCGQRSMAQSFINLLLIDAALMFKNVVRLKGGDPAIFGRLHEEMAALKGAGLRYEIVPGVSSALAAAAQLGVSLTQRGVARSVTFATPALGAGQGAGSDWARVDPSSTLCLYMAGGELGACARRLMAEGWSAHTPVKAVRDVSAAQSSVWEGQLEDAPSRLPGPVTVLIGFALQSPATLPTTALSTLGSLPSLTHHTSETDSDHEYHRFSQGRQSRVYP
jgi:uroporphyrin-III C-methyltransferase